MLGCAQPADDVTPSATSSTAAPSSPFAWVAARPASEAAPEEFPARLLRTGGTEAVVVPPLPARLVGLAVRPGDSVAVGAPIARVVMPELDAALAALSGAEGALVILRRRRARLAALEAEGLVRASDVAAIELDLARHGAERLRARGVLAGAGVGHGGTVVLRSPIAGVVTEVPATLGELRRPEDGPLARIRSRGGQRIEATLPARPVDGTTYALRASGSTVAITLVNQVPSSSGPGYVAWFEAAAGVEMPAVAEGRVLARSPASAGAWVVPATAVGARGSVHYVVVRTRGGASPSIVDVELVRVATADAIVRGPLPDGALVASDPTGAASPGDGGAAR